MSYRNYYDSSPYSRPRDTGRTSSNISTDRPTSVTAKYINTTPSYKSSSIPVLNNDRSAREETPISAIANRYASYNKSEKPTSKYEKKDYTSKLTVPSPVSSNKSRDVSPVSTSSKYSLSRSSRHISPDRRTTKSLKEKTRDSSPVDREKHIPMKTDKSAGYGGLSSYKLYSRTPSYSRPASRTETKPEVTVNRYAIANRLSSSYLRSPTPVKRTSISPVSYTDTSKCESDKPLTPSSIITEEDHNTKNDNKTEHLQNGNEIKIDDDENIETISVVTRHTSPTPPGSSSYVRSRRADMAKTVEKLITRARKKPQMVDKEIQSDRLDDPTRSSRFGSTSRSSITNWTFYAPSSNNYTGYAGRYSTQYSNLRDNSNSNSYDRSSRSHSTEPLSRENTTPQSHSESSKDKILENNIVPLKSNVETDVCESNKNEDTSEIVINVNLKLKKAKSPVNSTELVSPEIIITNSQLPPQAPKTDSTGKTKKLKLRKSSTDSSSETTSKKKVLKKRSKSVSSTESDQGSEKSDKDNNKDTKSSKSSTKSSTGPNTSKSSSKKHSKSRESNSPESSITLSTQSSISEDESMSKSKTNDVSRTSADEISIPTDRSARQPSPLNKIDGGTEEAKSFLIRALAPVTNLFKLRYQDSNENSRWLDNSTSESTGKDISNLVTESGSSRSKSGSDNIVASSDDNVVKLKAIRHIESGERAWWLDSESDKKNYSHSSEKSRHLESGAERLSEKQSNEHSDGKRSLSKCKNYHDDEKPWWLDSSANIPEGIERLTPPRKSSSDSDKSDKFNFFKVRHIESGDKKDWWLTSNENSSISNKNELSNNISLSKSGSDQRSFPLRRIKHIESGERPWWLASDKNIPEGVEKLPTPPPQESDSSDSEEVRIYVPSSQIPPFPLHLPDDEPLGDRRSPEGLETPKHNEEYENRSSPYENNRKYRRRSSSSLSYQKSAEKYISRYTDIDDILGTSGQIYSPFMDSILARRTGQISFDDDECEEIDPTQVRIHDSTPQMPVIQKLGCRSDIVDYREEDEVRVFIS
ncbi:uncharacterized protein [Epargyreus clarus]|uniref:uncharacterized protein n=1 Tax=Epargyreus clarus TaxID=520877 RepID=UPI003C2F1B45